MLEQGDDALSRPVRQARDVAFNTHATFGRQLRYESRQNEASPERITVTDASNENVLRKYRYEGVASTGSRNPT